MTEIFLQDKLLTVEEVARILSVKPCTIIGWVYKKRIPFIKFGNGKKSPLRFNPKALNLWVDENSKDTGAGKQKSNNRSKQTLRKPSGQKMVDDFENFIEEIKKN